MEIFCIAFIFGNKMQQLALRERENGLGRGCGAVILLEEGVCIWQECGML